MSRPRLGWFAAACQLLVAVTSIDLTAQQSAASNADDGRPNIVLIFPDNLGWGEVGAYGSVRGAPTPNIDQLAADGIRLTNFNVEVSCAVSRAAILTGRYAIRTGAALRRGITLWEVTMADAFKSVGYATAMFGKWHLGGNDPIGSREPKHQGFDGADLIPPKGGVENDIRVHDPSRIAAAASAGFIMAYYVLRKSQVQSCSRSGFESVATGWTIRARVRTFGWSRARTEVEPGL